MRIKVTGYIDTDEMTPTDRDLNQEMGVSDEFYKGYMSYSREMPHLEDVEFVLEKDGEDI